MALSQAQQLELVKAEKAKLLDSYVRVVDLLSMYRSLAPDNGTRNQPPAGYWIKPGDRVLYGTITDGCLKPLGKSDDDEGAIEACWAHFDGLEGFVQGQEKRLQQARDAGQVPEEKPTRRRRRVVND